MLTYAWLLLLMLLLLLLSCVFPSGTRAGGRMDIGRQSSDAVKELEKKWQELAGRTQMYPLSNRESAREQRWGTPAGTPAVFSRGGSLLPSIYADARCIDAVIVT